MKTQNLMSRLGTWWAMLMVAFGLLAHPGCDGGGPLLPLIPPVDFTGQLIVAFGDSITSGVGDSAYPSSTAGYPFRLERMLAEEFPSARVLNRGLGGERTDSGLSRLRFVLSHDRPDFVLLLEGVNDIRDSSQSWAPGIAKNLEAMISEVKSAGAVPLIASLSPTARFNIWKTEDIEELQSLIERMAELEDIVFVDLYDAFAMEDDVEELLSDDGLHPNEEGYLLMANEWFDALTTRLQLPSDDP